MDSAGRVAVAGSGSKVMDEYMGFFWSSFPFPVVCLFLGVIRFLDSLARGMAPASRVDELELKTEN